VSLPVAGSLTSYQPYIGTDGIIGVKSGYTSEAGGCDVLAIQPVVDGRPVLVLAAVTGQHDNPVLETAAFAALHLARVAASGVVSVPVAAAGRPVATAEVSGQSVPVVPADDPVVLARPGETIVQRVVIEAHPLAGARPRTAVGEVVYSLGGQREVLPIVTADRLPTPGLLQRVF